MSPDGPVIEARDVFKVFVARENRHRRRAFLALHDVNLAIAPGRFVSLVGPSECGKSTLLNMIAGLVRPTEGEVQYRGATIDGVNTDVGSNKYGDVLRRWTKAANRASRLMRQDQAAAVNHLREHFPRQDPAPLALREIVPALSEDGTMNEQMMDKHLQFMLDDGQIAFKPSAMEGLLWTNSFIVK